MRVLLAHNRYRNPGGEERHVDLLESGLPTAGVEVRRFQRSSTELASPIRRATASLTLAYRPGGGGIGKALREWKPTVVHFHNIWPLLTPSAFRTVRRSGAKVVLTAHNYRSICPSGTLLRSGVIHEDCVEGSPLICGLRGARDSRVESALYGLALEIQRRGRMIPRWADAVVAPSRFMAGILARSGIPRELIHVIPHGLPLGEAPSGGGGRHALFAGRLTPEKGVRTLLEAARLAPEVPLLIAGDGPLRTEVELAGDNVRYAGRLDQQELRQALRDAAFTVAPSEWYDNLPFAAIESLHAGRAVVTTSLGGLPEIVDDGVTGLFVPPADPEALAASLRRLWRSGESVSMGVRARRVAEERFTRDSQIETLTGLYEQLVTTSA